MRGYSNRKAQRRKELLFGLAITVTILGIAIISAFNGGFSLEAGKLEMTLDASWSDGMKLSFASI